MPPSSESLLRFAPAVRAVHRSTAVLMGVCVVTAALLYVPGLAVAVGHRYAVKQVHVYTGLALPLPLLLGLRSAAVRADLGRLNRFSRDDRRWLSRRARRAGGLRVGKFNAGQKLNGALSAGAVLVLLGTGVLMLYPGLVRLALRTGATFVHDWTALALGLLVAGHVVKASRDRDASDGMRTGRVPRVWAQQHHPDWVGELDRSGVEVDDDGTVV